jgi:protein TonB
MNTMTYSRTAAPSDDDSGLARRLKAQWRSTGRFAPFAAIALGHAVLFYTINSGMLRNVTHAILPQVVNITFVASPEPLKQAPPPQPKTVPVAQKTPTFVPPLPQLNIVQTEPTITLPPPQPRTADATPSTAAPTPVAAPVPPAAASPKTVSGVEYIRAPQPVYPSIAKRMGETGVVTLRVLIGEKGLAEQVTIQKSSGSANLDEAGRQAVLRALYKPHIEDGKPVSVYALVPINFQLG